VFRVLSTWGAEAESSTAADDDFNSPSDLDGLRAGDGGDTAMAMDPIPSTFDEKVELFRKLGEAKDKKPILDAARRETLSMILVMALTDLAHEREDRDHRQERDQERLLELESECLLLKNKNVKLEELLHSERNKAFDDIMATQNVGSGGYGSNGGDANAEQDLSPALATGGDDDNGAFTTVKRTGSGNASGSGSANGGGSRASGGGNANGSGNTNGNSNGNATGNTNAKGKTPVCLAMMRGERCTSCPGGFFHPAICGDSSHVTRRADCSLWHLTPNGRIHASKKAGGGSHNPRNNAKGNKSGGNGPIGKNSDSHAVHKLAAAKLQHRMEMLELKNKYLVQAVKSKTTRPATYALAAAPPYTSTSAGSTAPQFQTQQIPFPSQLGSQQAPSQQQPAPAQPLLTDIMAALTALTRQVQHLQQQQN
jgi:hypothetical protein